MTQPLPGTGHPDRDLADLLTTLITTAARTAPRSLQKRIGPSEVGIECARRLAYKWLEWPEVNGDGDPWPSIVGTATHDWLANALEAHNRTLGRTRWLVEQRVHPAPGLTGSCDAYDTDTGTVLDHKVVGETSMRKYKKTVRAQYRVQAHLYGLGWEHAGHTPRRVALAIYPRGGLLTGLHIWSEPYDRDLALAAVQRLDSIRDLTNRLDPENRPEHWSAIPATPSSDCRYCPWMSPGSRDLATGCPGQSLNPPRPNQGFESLIA